MRERLKLSQEELTEDVNLLNVVNFGGGSYVLYAELQGDEIEIDTEPYSDNFARPPRLLPLEAKALMAAIDLLGDHLPEGSLGSARDKIVAALGDDPAHEGLQIAPTTYDDPELTRTINAAIAESRLLELDYYKENEDEFTKRRVEPYALINGREGWYLFSFDHARQDTRHFRLDRIKRARMLKDTFEPRDEVDPTADLEGWPRTGTLPTSRVARVWISPERARWERERRRVVEELADGALIVELPFAGARWLVREILKEAGDAAVLEPEDARAGGAGRGEGPACRHPGRATGRASKSSSDGGAPKDGEDSTAKKRSGGTTDCPPQSPRRGLADACASIPSPP